MARTNVLQLHFIPIIPAWEIARVLTVFWQFYTQVLLTFPVMNSYAKCHNLLETNYKKGFYRGITETLSRRTTFVVAKFCTVVCVSRQTVRYHAIQFNSVTLCRNITPI